METKKSNAPLISAIVIILVIAAIVAVSLWQKPGNPLSNPAAGAGSSGETVSDGTITFSYATSTFGLATTSDQVLVKAYIPPCDPDFDYCLYYDGSDYAGTNFDSAGVRIENRDDLASSQEQCLETLPADYMNIVATVATSTDYVTSVFSPLGDAGAGHYASGALYRLSYDDSCYEFETRIGQTQFANYPAGSIKQFTDADLAAVQAAMLSILNSLTLPTGERVTFSQAKMTSGQ